MECPACQPDLPSEAKFCNVCGEELELDCLACSKVNPLGSRFCLACGKRLIPGAPGENAEPSTDAERKQVTVLFSDLTGYTAMMSRHEPEEVKEITSRVFDGVREVAGKHEGFIERFAGDSVLALFGVPKAHEDEDNRCPG